MYRKLTYCKFLLAALLSCILPSICDAQQKKHYISRPLGIEQAGVNKVLCLKNGNTMLFHLVPGKRITVKIFDSLHKETASTAISPRILDIQALKNVTFKGLYGIGNEGVLFMEQEHLGKYGLVRLRFNSVNGNVIEEKLVRKSKSLSMRTRFFVMRNKESDDYAVFFCEEVAQFKTCKLDVVTYNSKHEETGDIPLEVDRKKYDFLEVLGADAHPEGICISLCLSNLSVNGSPSHLWEYDPVANVYDRTMAIYYIPKGSTSPKVKLAHLGEKVYPFHAYYTYNPIGNALNLLLLSYYDAVYKFGNELRPAAAMSDLLLKVSKDDMATGFNWIDNNMATDVLKLQTDTNHYFSGVPVWMFTNENGLSTIVSESFGRYRNVESADRPNLFETYLGNIGITQFGDDGNEIWGTVLPRAQYYKSYEHYYYANNLSKNWHETNLFRDRVPQVYNRQFLSVNSYTKDRNIYIIYNDADKNFNNSLAHPGDTVYTFEQTNTVLYKIDRKKEVTKSYVFGEPAGDYKVSFIEGADFDEQRGVYAALVQYKKGEDISLRMAWSHLE